MEVREQGGNSPTPDPVGQTWYPCQNMDSVCTANQRVREDDILLQNLYAIRSRMLKEVEA